MNIDTTIQVMVVCQVCNQPITDKQTIIKAPCGETVHKDCEPEHVAKCKSAECSLRALGF